MISHEELLQEFKRIIDTIKLEQIVEQTSKDASEAIQKEIDRQIFEKYLGETKNETH